MRLSLREAEVMEDVKNANLSQRRIAEIMRRSSGSISYHTNHPMTVPLTRVEPLVVVARERKKIERETDAEVWRSQYNRTKPAKKLLSLASLRARRVGSGRF